MIKGSVMEKLIKLALYQDASLVILRNTSCRNGGLILKKKPTHFERFSQYICTFFAPIIYWALVSVGGGGGLRVEKLEYVLV